MIRVNLAKAPSFTQTATAGTATIDFKSLGAGANANQALKVGALLFATVLVFAYERYSISGTRATLKSVTAEAAALQQEIQGFGAVDEVLESLAKEKAKMNEQLSVIRKISQKRAFKLQTILKVQEGLPSDVWLDEFNFNIDTITLRGFSRSPTSVQNFVQVLNDTEFIVSALNKELSRVKMGDEQVQKFEIEAKVMN